MCAHQRWRLPGLCAMLLAVLLQACATRAPAPIEDRGSTPPSLARSYRVQPGDTLYSIAWRYGLEYSRLAAANNIAPPFTIFVGQQLALREADAPSGRPVPPVASPAPAPGSKPVAKPLPKPVPKAEARPPPAGNSSPGPVPTRSPAVAQPPLRPAPQAAVATWRWPAEGSVVRRFSSTLHKGIDIAGAAGDPVVAVAAGQVVYAGTGIPGYGELLIVRHNARYLSAYGHNDRLLVGEGDSVKAGQKIATRGSSGTNAVKLHFEIRENGKPIDPLGLLPPR